MVILERVLDEDIFNSLVDKTNAGLSAIEVLSTRLDELIVNGIPTDGNSELVDIRTGYDGVYRPTAGESVRQQVQQIYNSVD